MKMKHTQTLLSLTATQYTLTLRNITPFTIKQECFWIYFVLPRSPYVTTSKSTIIKCACARALTVQQYPNDVADILRVHWMTVIQTGKQRV